MSNFHDLKEFNNLFCEYQHRFIRFANSYVQNEQLAEDFTTDAFMQYWENRCRLTPDTNPPAYILTTIKNKCINHLQHQKIRLKVEKKLTEHAQWLLTTRIATLEAFEPDELFSEEIKHIVNETLMLLPEQTRKIFMMSRKDNLTQKEIAELMGISTKGVEFHISKALKKLRNALADYLPAALIVFILL